MTTRSLYDHPLYYDILFGWDRGAEAAFYDGLFRNCGAPERGRLLEVACGTGQIGLRLAASGWRVTGLDLRPAMLAFLQERARARGLRVATTCGNMTDFQLPALHDGAFCPMGSFHLLADDDSAVAHLRAVAAALAPHGRYALDLRLSTTDDSADDDIESWSMSRGDVTVSAGPDGIVVAHSESGQRLSLEWGGTLRPYTMAAFQQVLDRAGTFAVEALYPEHRTSPEDISIFDLTRRATELRHGRAIVVLRLRYCGLHEQCKR
jgi:SAM-dependent methyltransferase